MTPIDTANALLVCSLVQPDRLEPNIIVYALKLLEEVSRFLQRVGATSEEIEKAIELWEALLEGPLEGVLQHPTPFLRACACDCLAAVGSAGFAGLQVGFVRGGRAGGTRGGAGLEVVAHGKGVVWLARAQREAITGSRLA